jgi:hypothetical protein
MIERELTALLNRAPFEPFRIRLLSSDAYDVAYAESVALLEEGVYIASRDGERATFPFDRIASLEALIVFE